MLDRDERLNGNIIVFGVGHSGTSILVRMLNVLGWNLPSDTNSENFESAWLISANEHCLRTGALPTDASQFVERLSPPWIIKDPRMVVTLPHWQKIIKPCDPTLIWIAKPLDEVLASHVRRGEIRNGKAYYLGLTIQETWNAACQSYDGWNGKKATIEYHRIAEAVKLFVPRQGT